MANLFDKMIEELKAKNGGEEDEFIQMLRAKRDELGDDASEVEIIEAIKSCLEEFAGPEDGEDDGEEDEPEESKLTEEQKLYMADATATVKKFLDDNEWHYNLRTIRDGLVVYELGFTVKGTNLRLRIYVEADPDVCRIDAILPINADAIYEYPLCKLLTKINYSKRFGSFRYDERDGEISYEYSFLSKHGINIDELDIYFHAIINTAADSYSVIRKCCVGRFSGEEKTEILNKLNDLVNDITDD